MVEIPGNGFFHGCIYDHLMSMNKRKEGIFVSPVGLKLSPLVLDYSVGLHVCIAFCGVCIYIGSLFVWSLDCGIKAGVLGFLHYQGIIVPGQSTTRGYLIIEFQKDRTGVSLL